MKIQLNVTRLFLLPALIVAAMLTFGQLVIAANKPVIVNVDNFVRAETAFQFDRMIKMAGGINKWAHNREPTPLDRQNVIRMNRDTLYSFAIVDISKGAILTLPDPGKRYMSVMVVNEDEYINNVYHDAGTFKLTMAEFDTQYVLLAGRTMANPDDPEDVKKANALQDQLKIDAQSAQPYSHPTYDQDSYEATYKLLLELSKGIPNSARMFGKKEEVSEVRHLLGAAFGWGGLPEYEAIYVTENKPRPIGRYQITLKEKIPVDGFASISVYNKDGYFEENKFNSYSFNSLTAKRNEDGSVTINFGGCEEGLINCLYIMDGWNYVVRLYQPHKVIQEGKWTFPEPRIVE